MEVSVSECQNCGRLAAENAALRNEVAKLKNEVERLQRTVRRLQRKINAALLYAMRAYGDAACVLRRKSGVPRGTWSLAKGQGIVAKRVHDILRK